MINTQLKFEGKIDYGSKVVAITRNYTSFRANLTLKVKVTRFQTHLKDLDDQCTDSKQFNFKNIKTKIMEVSRTI